MNWTLTTGDCLDVLPTLAADSIDACVTDPPYGWNFMGRSWDHGIPGTAYWTEVFRVLKPGGWLLAFGGPRTHHRLMTAIEDAGFELRDCLCWLFGSGFPKALNISKAIDKAAGAKREVIGEKRLTGNACVPTKIKGGTYGVNVGTVPPQTVPITAPATPEAKLWDGWASALKPAYEPIILAMKPLDGTFAHNALTHGVAGLHVDGCRIASHGEHYRSKVDNRTGGAIIDADKRDAKGQGMFAPGRSFQPTNHIGGRWPANVILDEEAGAMLDEQTGDHPSCNSPSNATAESKYRPGQGKYQKQGPIYPGDNGGASRFFYCAKSSRSERTAGNTITNHHATVKPIALMRWLCRLVSTPTGGTILDPFAGSGSTGVAALKESLSFVGIEISDEYAQVARARLEKEHQTPKQGSLFDLIGDLG